MVNFLLSGPVSVGHSGRPRDDGEGVRRRLSSGEGRQHASVRPCLECMVGDGRRRSWPIVFYPWYRLCSIACSMQVAAILGLDAAGGAQSHTAATSSASRAWPSSVSD
jgi:hypothetical protein